MPNLNLVTSTRQVSPEIADALKTARFASFRLEDEFAPFDWEARLELADELRQLSENLPEELAPVAREVARRVEDEASDFGDWEERLAAANMVRAVITGLRQQGGAR
jgi:hypothetical protein